MLFRLILFLGVLFWFPSFSQTTSITVGGNKMDDNLIQAIKQLQPDFGLNGDSDDVVAKVLKAYSLKKYLADLAHQNGIDTLPELKEKLTVSKQILEEKLIAEYYSAYALNTIPVSNDEIKQYYTSESEQFSIPGNCNVIYAETSDTSKATVSELKKIATENALLPIAERMNLKKYNDVYLIKNYLIHSNNKGYPFLKEIFAAKLKSRIGPFFSKESNRYVYFLIIERQEPTYMPFESVKAMCIQNLQTKKYNQLYQKWNEDALEKYPIKINDNTK
jgi:hypothetical protein